MLLVARRYTKLYFKVFFSQVKRRQVVNCIHIFRGPWKFIWFKFNRRVVPNCMLLVSAPHTECQYLKSMPFKMHQPSTKQPHLIIIYVSYILHHQSSIILQGCIPEVSPITPDASVDTVIIPSVMRQ